MLPVSDKVGMDWESVEEQIPKTNNKKTNELNIH